MNNKKAIIFGVSGQDGSYLAQLLLKKGYQVIGTSRDTNSQSFENLKRLKIFDQVMLLTLSLTDLPSIQGILLDVNPDEIYNLSGQSSVSVSFKQPVETINSIVIGTKNILEAIRLSGRAVKFYNACSSECFGDTHGLVANEDTPFNPKSPYATAKSESFFEVMNYRSVYGLFCCSGIMFNHESPLRGEFFVTRKIVKAACRIYRGSKETLKMGDLSVQRDWGWAPEYVNAMWLMLQQDCASDFVVATGHTYTLEEFVKRVFEGLGLDWRKYVSMDSGLLRSNEIKANWANAQKINNHLHF